MDPEIARAAMVLAEVRAEAEQTRAVLDELQTRLAASTQLNAAHVADILEANEQLVIAVVQAKTDAEDAMRALLEVSRVAELDGLTQLPNRMLFLDRFTQAITGKRRRHARMALLFLDLNSFKQINDTLGHAVGDEVLKFASRCMVESVRASDTVSRHGGDEFLILLSEVAQASDAAAIADKIHAALARPTRVGDHVMSLTASIGISLFPDDGEDACTLIDRADAAMYRAKRLEHSHRAFYDQSSFSDLDAPAASPDSLRRPLHSQLQEANEQLLLSALDAQTSRSDAEHALQRHTENMARAVHELRAPLMSIRTASAVLARSGSIEPMLPRMNAVIERQVAQLSRLVGDLLDVSRINGGKLRVEQQPVDLLVLIDEVIEICRPAMEKRGQQLQLQRPTAGPIMLHADPMRLAQVVRNLLDNASKYTPPAGVITLTVAATGDSVVLKVRDNGIGITPRALPHVFDAFVQDSHAAAFNSQGLGLGLTVVRELVGAHGGSVTVHSDGQGLGSEFTVTLPASFP
jgi:diguanylate cyclase (GGDEF)-like protein